MTEHNNVNVVSRIETNNVNDNVVTAKIARERVLQQRADELLSMFGLPKTSRGFMYQAVKKLSCARIQDHYETAQKGTKSKVGLFIYLCQLDGVGKAHKS